VRLNKESFATRLQRLGFSTEAKNGLLSEVGEIISDTQVNRFVRWAGSLAGWDAGRYEINGKPILVTDSPTIIQATHGDDSMMYDFIERLLGDDQAIYYHTWIKLAREALLSKSLRRGPVVFIIGEGDQGKTVLGNMTSLMLGGRQADPTQFAQGETAFNAHLFGAELLFSDDKGGGRYDHHAQLRTASVIKQLVANKTPECHGKNKTPLGLTPYWRVIYALNDEPEDLLVLPALSKGIMDKLMIFKTVGRAIDRSTKTDDEFKAYEADLIASIPDYLGWLEEWEIPKEYLIDRFGQKVYHAPEVLESVQTFAPETKLLQLIDEVGGLYDQKLEARVIEKTLKEPGISPVEREALDLLKRPGSCGKYLTRLCQCQPKRVEDAGRLHGGSTRYAIRKP
jgi:hypothetical protein